MTIKTGGLPTIEKPHTKAVHYLRGGHTPCPISHEHGVPMTWPRGHVWSQQWQDVTCAECLAAKPEGGDDEA